MRTLFDRAAAHRFTTEVARATVDELHAADAVWLLSSVRGAARVNSLDGRNRGDAGLTARVQAALGH